MKPSKKPNWLDKLIVKPLNTVLLASTLFFACSKSNDNNPKPEPGNKNPLEVNVSGNVSKMSIEPNSLSGEANKGGALFKDVKTGKQYSLSFYTTGTPNATVSLSSSQILKTGSEDRSKPANPEFQETVAYENPNTYTLYADFDDNTGLTQTLGADKVALNVAGSNAKVMLAVANQNIADQLQNNLTQAANEYSNAATKVNSKGRFRVEIMEVK